MAKKRELDINIISNASLKTVDEVIRVINLKGGNYSYKKMKLIVDKDLITR